MESNLSGIPETLLIPLWARAVESKRPDAIIRDDKAVEIIRRIEYDFSKFDRTWMSQLGISVRTKLLDDATKAFLQRHPESVIVNLGAGLDTRCERLDNGKITWYDLDLPEVIALRRNFFAETDRYHLIAKSLFDSSWVKGAQPSGKSVLMIAEGLLMYFEEEKVRNLFDNLATHFPGAEMLLEILGPALVGKGKYHDTVSQVEGAEFRWSLRKSRELESWNQKIKFIEEWHYTDYYRERWRWFGVVTRWSVLKRLLSNKIVHVRFEA